MDPTLPVSWARATLSSSQDGARARPGTRHCRMRPEGGGNCARPDRPPIVSRPECPGGRRRRRRRRSRRPARRLQLGLGRLGASLVERPPQRHLHRHPQEGRDPRLRGRGRGAGLRPGHRPLRRDRRPLRTHRLRPAHHHRRRRQRPALPGPVGDPQRGLLGVDHRRRPGVVFHDGTPCDAAAIAGSIEHFITACSGSPSPPSKRHHRPRRRTP